MPVEPIALPSHLKLVLLDRDGVINHDSEQFIKNPDEWQPIPGALSAIAALQRHFDVAICTNQSGVGRGLFDESALDGIHNKLSNGVCEAGGRAVDIFYCPHHPDDGCDCRKPKPGLLATALSHFGHAAEHTIYVGDSLRDLQAAEAAACAAVLVLTGNGHKAQSQLAEAGSQPTSTFDSLADFATQLTQAHSSHTPLDV